MGPFTSLGGTAFGAVVLFAAGSSFYAPQSLFNIFIVLSY
jgi:hypothetical protein